MKTINELIDQCPDWLPGSLKIVNKYDTIFIPYYKNAGGTWFGKDKFNNSDWWGDKNIWKVWTKPKVKLYQFAYKHTKSKDWHIWNKFYRSEQDIKDSFNGSFNYKRLDYTMIEVDDES
jgi:hypothetical protein